MSERQTLNDRVIPERATNASIVPASPTEILQARVPTRGDLSGIRLVPSIGGGGSVPERGLISDNGSGSDYQSFYGGSPFGVLADLYRNVFGNSDPVIPTGQQSVIPVPIGSSDGSSNSLLIIGIIALAGFGIYWFYFRKSQ